MASVDKIEHQLEVATTEYRRCVEELKQKGEKLEKLMEGEKEDEFEKEDEITCICNCGCSKIIPKEKFAELREAFQALSRSEQDIFLMTQLKALNDSGVGKWSRIKKL
ncbi:hypothetical protein G9A89_004007 [Geosiphon pyriformis]|nr:hypothetical protein G9A89_004007 [Geosiphon pyriformis]